MTRSSPTGTRWRSTGPGRRGPTAAPGVQDPPGQSEPRLHRVRRRAVPRAGRSHFASRLVGFDVEFWYDQFLAKPPGRSVATSWHQDEAYWGRDLDERGITCWMPFHDVDVANGCMHFIDGGHRDGVLPHERVPNMASDLLHCAPDESRGGRLPHRPRERHLPPRQDPAHDHAQHLVLLAPDPHPAPPSTSACPARATTSRGRCTSTSSPAT